MFFVLFLLDDRRIRIRSLTNGSGSGRPKNIPYGSYESGSATLLYRLLVLFYICRRIEQSEGRGAMGWPVEESMSGGTAERQQRGAVSAAIHARPTARLPAPQSCLQRHGRSNHRPGRRHHQQHHTGVQGSRRRS